MHKNEVKKYLFSLMILLIFIGSVLIVPNVFATKNSDSVNSNFTINQYMIITVSDTDLITEAHLSIINPYNYEQHINVSIEIPWIYRQGNAKIYGLNGSDWVPIPKNQTFLHYETDAPAGGRKTLIIKNILNDTVTKDHDTYQFSYFIAGSFNSNIIEMRIPSKKGFKKLEILNYSMPPSFEADQSNYHIARWDTPSSVMGENETYNDLGIQYTYRIPWSDYFDKIIWIMIGAVITLVIERIPRLKKKLSKSKKLKKKDIGKKD